MTSSLESIGQRFHLFGYPIAHSAAPAFHNECFSALGRVHHFATWSTSAVTTEMLREIRSDATGGAAVTMPLKTAILEHLDVLTPAAQATRACNTIVKVSRTGKTPLLIGTNTDVLGVRNALLGALRAQHPTYVFGPAARFLAGAGAALVIGGGATTRSAVYALHGLGLAPIFLVNRDAEEVAQVIESFAGTSVELVHLRDTADVERHLSARGDGGEALSPKLAMVVGAIPAIAPSTPAEQLVYALATLVFSLPHLLAADAPVSAGGNALPLPTQPIFLDMAYKPRDTPLLGIARAQGWAAVGGVQAMIEQGLAQQRMWLVGSVEDEVACAGPQLLGEDVERRARRLVDEMTDVVVSEKEVDRALGLS